jgi:hypothetical protein
MSPPAPTRYHHRVRDPGAATLLTMEDLFDPSINCIPTHHQPPDQDELRALIEHVRITEALRQLDLQQHQGSTTKPHASLPKSDTTPD